MKPVNKCILKCVFFFLPAFAALFSSCVGEYEKYNTNPHQATGEMMKRDNLKVGTFFVQMQKNVIPIAQQPDFGDEQYQIIQNLAGDAYSGYLGTPTPFLGGSNNTTYAMVPGWYGAAYDRAFVSVLPAWRDIKKAAETEVPQSLAMATLVKIISLQRTTDMYGPLPYTNFEKGSLQTTFDSQKDIYYSFFKELKEAIETLTEFNTKNPEAKVLEDFDFIYSGDVRKWIKFGNSLRLRLAMRIAYADPGKAKQEAEAAAAHSLGFMSAAADAAQLNHLPKLLYNHPLYIICFNFNDTRMGATIDSYMNGYKDPRTGLYFNPTDSKVYRGIRSGIQINNKASYAPGGNFSTLNITTTFPVIWMHAAEVYFLRAEGAIRGWDMKGTAKELYESGIKTSFDYWGAGGYDNYIADNTSKPAAYTDVVNGGNSSPARGVITIKWDEAADMETKLERIITQKYIAMYPDGQEAWSEFRRTGYPKIFPVALNRSNGAVNTETQIRRLPFPQSLYTTNPDAVNQGVSLLGGADNAGTKLWWDKKK